MKTLYFECTSGISGDMSVAALLDLGADEAVLRSGLESLGVDGFRIEVKRVNKSGIDACDFNVILDEEAGEGHTHPHLDEKPHTHEAGHTAHVHSGDEHDHAHWHENGNDFHAHTHTHNHDGQHPHTHDLNEHEHSHVHNTHSEHNEQHEHSHSHGGHVHRNVTDIYAIIEASGISANAKRISKKIFNIVAMAEAKVHGKPVDEVHFHEVGAVDSIVDIIGAAICVDNLEVDRIICSPLREGTGMVKCQHGLMPVPAPATLEIIRSHNIPLVITDNKGEMVTPTGAAIIAALAESFETPKNVTVSKIGYGAGKREYKTANVVRAMLLEEAAAGETPDNVLKIECNLDDMTGEELSYACEKLMEAGALDVWTTPIFMKKGRPGYMLSVLSATDLEGKMTNIIFKHTTTIGVRLSSHARRVMERTGETAQTEYGPIPVKVSSYGEIRKSKPEFDHIKKLAAENDASVTQILRSAYNVQD